MDQLLTAIELASIMSLVALAALLTFRMAGFPDLSVDGVFSLGAVIFAKCYFSGLGLPASVLFAVLGGIFSGFVTATISQKLKIHPILASVLVLTILFSINLRILGKPNLTLINLSENLPENPLTLKIIYAIISLSIISLSYVFFLTEMGSGLRTTGKSPVFLSSVGKNPFCYRIILVSIAGGLVALAGCLLAIKYRYANVYFGNGVIIIGIASLIIGEKICSRHPFWSQILAVPIGALVYHFSSAIALGIGLSPVDVKLVAGIISIALLAMGSGKEDDLLAEIK